MQSNKIVRIVGLTLILLLSMWVMEALLEANHQTRNIIIGVSIFIILLLVLWRKIPIDIKFLFIVMLGYAIGGKGFAYLSPVAPIYIGEICFAFCLFGYVLRSRQWGLMDTPIHKLIWIYIIYAAIHLQIDYAEYGVLAIRDSATVYYAFFFIAAFVMFRNERVVDAFEKIIKVTIVFGIIQWGSGLILRTMGIYIFIPGYHPHCDSSIPLLTAASLFFLCKGMESKSIICIVTGAVATVFLMNTKTAAFIAFFAVFGTAVFWGRVKGLLVPSSIIILIGTISIAIIAMVNTDIAMDMLSGGEHAEALGIQGGEFVGLSGSSSWRWDWWMTIWDDTMKMAPFLGQGFGSDISTPYLGYSEHALSVRYPHNIIFTIVGRLGLIGLIIFMPLFIAVGVYSLILCKRFFQSPHRRDADLIAYAIVVAGMINGVLQATYEVPYGAITHWVCVGYLVRRVYDTKHITGNLSKS